MQIGDLVVHKESGRKLTVKALSGNQVLCGWMEKNSREEFVEASAAFDWQSLRSPTDEERAGTVAPAPPVTVIDDSEADLVPEVAEPAHKRKGR